MLKWAAKLGIKHPFETAAIGAIDLALVLAIFGKKPCNLYHFVADHEWINELQNGTDNPWQNKSLKASESAKNALNLRLILINWEELRLLAGLKMTWWACKGT